MQSVRSWFTRATGSGRYPMGSTVGPIYWWRDQNGQIRNGEAIGECCLDITLGIRYYRMQEDDGTTHWVAAKLLSESLWGLLDLERRRGW